MVEFLKYEFYNKLLNGVRLLGVIPGITWTQPYIDINLKKRSLKNNVN